MFPLILASTSRYRRELMQRLGLPFEAVPPEYEEEHDLDLAPEDLVQELAERKARSLAKAHPDRWILGSDQVVELDGRILGKPGSAEAAAAQLADLAGRSHRLLTGVVLLDAASGRVERALDVHLMTMRPLSPDQIVAYVAREMPTDCAGAYRVEGPGIALFASMEGRDFTGIIGLPLTRVVDLMERLSRPANPDS